MLPSSTIRETPSSRATRANHGRFSTPASGLSWVTVTPGGYRAREHQGIVPPSHRGTPVGGDASFLRRAADASHLQGA